MEDIGLMLTFPDAESSVSFASALRKPEVEGGEVQVVTTETKLHMDGPTLILLIKAAGTVAGTLLAFLKLAKELLQGRKKPSVIIVFKERRVELYGNATEEDLLRLAHVLAGG
jgi:hypothetical protein